jgi:hypothetical protein
VPQTSAFEVELGIEKLRSHRLPDIVQMPAKLIKEVGREIHYEIHRVIISIWNKEELPEQWKESIIVLIYKKGNSTDCSTYRCISILPLRTKLYPTFCCQG